MGKPLRESRGEALARDHPPLRRRRGVAAAPASSTSRPSEPAPLHAAAAARRRRADHALELPDRDPRLEARPALVYGNTVVLKLGYEAPLTGPARRGGVRRGRPARRRPERADGRRLEGGSAELVQQRGRARDLVHRLGAGRPRRARRGDRARLPRPARAGRPQPAGRHGRRRARPRRRGRLTGAFWSAGQKCTATRRILVQDAVYDEFRDACSLRIAARQGRRPADPRSRSGRSSTRRAEEMPRRDRARPRRGRTVLAGGERADDEAYLVAPTPSSRASPTTPSSPARRCSVRSPRSTASPTSTRRSPAPTPFASASPPRSSRATCTRPAVHRGDRRRDHPRQLADRGRRRARAVRRRQGVGWGRTSRAAP